jgi:hypothetical protein
LFQQQESCICDPQGRKQEFPRAKSNSSSCWDCPSLCLPIFSHANTLTRAISELNLGRTSYKPPFSHSVRGSGWGLFPGLTLSIKLDMGNLVPELNVISQITRARFCKKRK